MPSLVQARRKIKDAGQPIHQSITKLKEYGAEIHRGQLSMIVAGAGAGKSLLAQAMLTFGDGRGNKNTTLYFCSDTTPDIMFRRAASMVTGYAQKEIDRMVEAGASTAIEQKVLKEASHIEWEFKTHITPTYVLERLGAYVEMHDAYPEVIVVDILRDLSDSEDADEFRALEDTTRFLRDLAAETGAAVLALHHTNGPYEDGSIPAPLSSVRGRVSKTASLIYTIHRPEPNELRISPVKNRNGRADSSGKLFAAIKVDFGNLGSMTK